MGAAWQDEVRRIDEGLGDFLESLHDRERWGRFAFAPAGTTPLADEIGLGFSCRALHLALTARLWDAVEEGDRQRWLDYIRSFQDDEVPPGQPLVAQTFRDLSRHAFDARRDRPRRRRRGLAWRRWRLGDLPDPWPRLVVRETRLALGVLSAAGSRAGTPYRDFPFRAGDVRRALASLDWRDPSRAIDWAADLAVLLVTQAPHFRDLTEITAAREALAEVLVRHQDPATALWGEPERASSHAERLATAARAVLALRWLGIALPRPGDLLASCLELGPGDELEQWSDWTRIVHACALFTTRRRLELREVCAEVTTQLVRLRVGGDGPDAGGLARSRGASTTHFLGHRIGDGRAQPDLLATATGVDTLARLLAVLEDDCVPWTVFNV